jgi:hypothetical protein
MSKSVDFANSSGSMPAKHKRCRRGHCRNRNRRLSCRRKSARRLHWRKFSISPSKRAARISIANHPTNGGNRLQLFFGMPVEFDAPAQKRRPVMIWFWQAHRRRKCSRIFSFAGGRPIFRLIPAQALRLHGLTFVISFFLKYRNMGLRPVPHTGLQPGWIEQSCQSGSDLDAKIIAFGA